MNDNIKIAAEATSRAEGLLICTGAGMGADSGLPTFRGNEGFWKAYPALRHLGISFKDMANPEWFHRDPRKAWAFYGHRYKLYNDTQPHDGYQILKGWADSKPGGAAVFTSNVDGHFKKSGFSEDRICECHGSILHFQCTWKGCHDIWPADGHEFSIDMENFQAEGDLPSCPSCGSLARPNILMFGDRKWRKQRTRAQEERVDAWIDEMAGKPIAIIEIGAGTAIKSVRDFTNEISKKHELSTLIRINPGQADAGQGDIPLQMGALEALVSIEEEISSTGYSSDEEVAANIELPEMSVAQTHAEHLLTSVGFETPFGYKDVEVFCADITKVSGTYDLLVASAFSGGYEPVDKTLFRALKDELEIDMEVCSGDPYIDLRNDLSIWVSQDLDCHPYRRILCVEMVGSKFESSLDEVFENIFAGVALLVAKGIKVKSLAMPVLGTGSQGIPEADVIPPLLRACSSALHRIPELMSITFMERNPEKAQTVVSAIDDHLGRAKTHLPSGEIIDSARREILEHLRGAQESYPEVLLWEQLEDVFSVPNLESHIVGANGRRVLEYILDIMVPASKKETTGSRIYRLQQGGMPTHIISYMHILKNFGNVHAHVSPQDTGQENILKDLDGNDFMICLFCINKILSFWLELEHRLPKVSTLPVEGYG